MVIILPKNASFAAAEAALSPENLTALEQSSSLQRVMVYIPKFRLQTRYDLVSTLAEMGMPTAFTAGADFSGMDGRDDLYVSDVIHMAYADVNEEGTEAAAATVAVMRLTAIREEPPVPVFRADHPFIFIIRDNNSGAVLFAGRVVDPAEE
jgi:serpin B